MKKMVPYAKLSKKEKRKLNAARRKDWHGVNPVTRRVESKVKYNRKRARAEENFFPDGARSFFKRKTK